MKQEEIEKGLAKLKARMPKRWNDIACDEGWYKILFNLDEALAEICHDYRIAQIKEKFGGLRFYIESGPSREEVPLFYELIRKAEDLSYRTCEVTGGPGVLMKKIGGGYIRTLNPESPGVLDNWEVVDSKYLKDFGR